MKMKISLISTVLNEEKNIDFFIKSIINQSKKPDGFIIVDGGSTDKTYDILKKFSKKYKWIKVFQKKGANISRGRNIAIEKAKNDIIVTADAGTRFRKTWLRNLVRGFNGVASYGKNIAKTDDNEFQKLIAKKIMHDKACGSSRNMIFSKKIWKEVGGYPEDMIRGEDSLFDERIIRKGYKINMVKDAVGEWEMRLSLKEVKRQYYLYGYWDGIAYRRYKIVPLKTKIAVTGLTILLPLYPLGCILSMFSLSFKIDFIRRFAFLKGFIKGFFGLKLW
ncbi:hypothetical protein ES703_77723 [subsurface metagenome]